ncbi:MAG: hypothetical protein A2X08_04560 [Bacteroidetes bacterium GWA2_32_17]|nr:MAG: hypothetical protein A2X08_04560 [Bacteroidetes bacterium GWA2_32_17]
MKKLLLIVAVITAFSFVSCKKDRTCTCTTSVNGTVVGDPNITTYNKSMKGDARLFCMSTTEVDGSTTTKVECTLK